MSRLAMTPARRLLMRDVEESLVWRSERDGEAYRGSSIPGKPAPQVTDEVEELESVGWIKLRWPGSSTYTLTDEGRQALADASERAS